MMTWLYDLAFSFDSLKTGHFHWYSRKSDWWIDRPSYREEHAYSDYSEPAIKYGFSLILKKVSPTDRRTNERTDPLIENWIYRNDWLTDQWIDPLKASFSDVRMILNVWLSLGSICWKTSISRFWRKRYRRTDVPTNGQIWLCEDASKNQTS